MVVAVAFFVGCSESELEVDEAKLQAIENKVERAVEKGRDSINAKYDRLRDSLNDKPDTLTQ